MRILPMYYLFTLLTIVAWFVNPGWFPSTVLTPLDDILSLLFIPSVYIKELDTLTPVLSVGWTLCYEMLFYLVFAVGMLFRRSAGLTFIFVSIGVLMLAGYLSSSQQSYFLFYTNEIMLYFLSGIVCFMLQNRTQRRYSHGVLSLMLTVALLTFSTLWLQGIFRLLVLTASFCLLTGLEFNVLCQSFITMVASAVGLASYSIYLCHRLFMGALVKVLHYFMPAASTAAMYIAMAILSVASGVAGFIIYRLIEKRITMMFRVRSA